MLPKVCLPAHLSPAAKARARHHAIAQRPDNAPNWRMLSDMASAGVPAPVAAVFLTNTLWPHGRKIKASFMSVGSSAQDQIRHQLDELYSYTNLSLEWVPSGGEVRISDNPNIGSWSYMGSQCLQITQGATMNIGWLDGGVVYHEGGHSLGMGHGHKNPKTPWEWDEAAVYRDLMGPPNNWTREQVKHNVLDRYTAEEVSASDPDYDSVMAYRVPNSWTIGDYEVAENETLSATDIEWLRRTYPEEDPKESLRRLPIEHYDRASNREKAAMGNVILTAGRDREEFALVTLLGRFGRN